jgi:hypothetical protein
VKAATHLLMLIHLVSNPLLTICDPGFAGWSRGTTLARSVAARRRALPLAETASASECRFSSLWLPGVRAAPAL